MQLNIKDEIVHRMAKELAELTGDSLTGAIRKAVADQLAAEKAARPKKRVDMDKVNEILEIFHRELGDQSTPDHGEMLYDEYGLPK